MMDIIQLFTEGGMQLALLSMLFYFMKKLFNHTSEITAELKELRLVVERLVGYLEGLHK